MPTSPSPRSPASTRSSRRRFAPTANPDDGDLRAARRLHRRAPAPTASCSPAWRASSRRSSADERRAPGRGGRDGASAGASRWSSACRPRMPPPRRRCATHAQAVGAAAVMAVAPPSLQGRPAAHRRLLRAHRRGGRAGDPAERAAAGGLRAVARARSPRSCARSPAIRYVKEESLPCGQRITQLLRGAGAGARAACSAAPAAATSPTSSRAAPAARCPRASSSTCTCASSRCIAPATPPACAICSTGCCRCSISRRCSGWR